MFIQPVPMMFASDLRHSVLLADVGRWRVYPTDISLRDAINGVTITQPTAVEPAGVEETGMDGDAMTFRIGLVFSVVSLSPHLFRLGAQVVALYAPDDASEEEVLVVAQELYGDVEPLAA